MSITYFTLSSTKYKSFFFDVNFKIDSCWFVKWPEGQSYIAWQKVLKCFLWFIGTDKHVRLNKPKRRGKQSRRYRKFLRMKTRLEDETIQRRITTIIYKLQVKPITINNENIELELITILKQFWERKHMSQHIEKTIPDHRNQDLITYTKQSIMMSALAIFLFRMGSGNKFDNKSHDTDEKYSMTNIAKFIDAPSDRVPVIKTIEKFLTNLKEHSINDLMISFFKDLQHSKFFQQHRQLMPGDFFLLAADCVHTHTYEEPHYNDCKCCLKRIYNKGTENEKIKWMHNTLVFSFVFMGGLKIPIYSYPIHAKQIVNLESAPEATYKQECEIVALKMTLPIIREAFPKMKIVLLLDGLYANKPVIRLAEKHRCGYIIVKKEGCLPSLTKECDEVAIQDNHKKNCVKRCKINHKHWLIEQKYEWFNSKYLGEGVSTNVLRFWESRTDKEGKIESYKLRIANVV